MDKTYYGAIVRNILQAIGGSLVAQGVMSGDTMNAIIGGVMGLATVAWSLWQKRKAVVKVETAAVTGKVPE